VAQAPGGGRHKPAAKSRLDLLLVARGLAPNRTKAEALLRSGRVYSGEERLEKPGTFVDDTIPLEVRRKDHEWVGRGGVKLAHALDHFAIDLTGLVALDIGASTGGFTDVLLAKGAAKVYAVDVGHGQLDHKLRTDPRVVVLERTNARHLTTAEVGEPVGVITCDASFISLAVILPAALRLARPGCFLVALIKPQFEVGKGKVGKGGVVRDPAQHLEVCKRTAAWLGTQPDWTVLGITKSPLQGADGNVEFLIGARYK